MFEILSSIKENADAQYAIFQKKLVPDTKLVIYGVRVPILKNIAKQAITNHADVDFLKKRPDSLEELFVYGFIICYKYKSLAEAQPHLLLFLEYLDNWAACDSVAAAMKFIGKEKELCFNLIKKLSSDKRTYVARFAFVSMLDYFIEDKYLEDINRLALNVRQEDYYVDVAVAWLYSVMLVKQYDFTVNVLKNKLLPPRIHNKAIQKAVESFRITQEQKEYLKTLKNPK